jgi:hypothetical protein
MPYVRKNTAGSSSHGYVWPEDGAVVEMPHEHAEELLVITDGGFSLADGPSGPGPDDEDEVLTEVLPEPDEPVTEPAPDEASVKAPVRRGGRKPAEG